ncbi:MAG: hypothetical protein QW803_13135 [Candidatus Methanomethylicia archaeon]
MDSIIRISIMKVVMLTTLTARYVLFMYFIVILYSTTLSRWNAFTRRILGSVGLNV